ELDRWGVRVSLINPGFVDTPAQEDNAFPKPFMISSDEAARRIVRSFKGQAFEVSFPKRFTYGLKLLSLLPAKTRLNLVKKQTGWAERPDNGGMTGPE
ncbi:MAG: oxidoreductase, partial [Pseudomonadota bacterium]